MLNKESPVSILFTYMFKGVAFDTDEGMGQDESLANILNEKYGNLKLEIRADNEDEALAEAINQLSEISGYCVLDADYDMQVS